jgi:hypothetical protein
VVGEGCLTSKISCETVSSNTLVHGREIKNLRLIVDFIEHRIQMAEAAGVQVEAHDAHGIRQEG